MKTPPTRPPFRQVLATWLALYPLLTLLLWAFAGPLAQLALPVRTFVLTVFLVPVLAYLLVPRVVRLLNWSFPAPEKH
ncbi:MAG: hypothetical protein P8R54_19235 [Myxococcota bacterium]|nr:hypothetical protein [Myxococcota bacterium]